MGYYLFKCIFMHHYSSLRQLHTRLDDGPVVHEDHHVRLVHKLDAVGAKDSGLPLQKLQDALLHEVFGYVRVYSG